MNDMRMHFADIWERVAHVVPDRVAIRQGDRLTTWRDFEERSARLAGYFLSCGIGVGDKVGLFLHNCPEYLEAQFAALKIRAVPINLNYRYLDDELAYLLDNADVRLLVHSTELTERVAGVADRVPGVHTRLAVGNGEAGNADRYEGVVAAHDPAPVIERSESDVYILYTGGTTGMPKGVMYEVGGVVRYFLASTPPLLGLEPITDPEHVAGAVENLRDADALVTVVPGPPLMHGTGAWMGAMAPHCLGSTVALLEKGSYDATEMVDLIQDARANLAIVVGDVFVRPLLAELDLRAASGTGADLSSLRIVASSGAMLAASSKQRLLEHAPQVMILDMLGSSEGGMGANLTVPGAQASTASFRLNPGARVVRDDFTDVIPGSGEVGLIAVTGLMTPIGYYKDPEKSANTFKVVDGVRYSIPGDMALVEADGEIRFLGRGSGCINTGGEKVFPEEVEEVLKQHENVDDCVVLGIDDELYGQAVAALVSTAPGHLQPSADEIIAFAKERIAGYKVPRHLVVVETVPRGPNGKADYSGAKELLRSATVD